MKIRDYLALTSVIILSSCNGGSNSNPSSNKANNIGAAITEATPINIAYVVTLALISLRINCVSLIL